MAKPRIIVTSPIPGTAVERLCKRANVELLKKKLPSNQLAAKLANADGVLSLLTDKIDASVIAAAKKLRIISNYAVGFDNIDLKTATARSIVVTNTPGVPTVAVAEFTIMLMLAVSKRIIEADAFMRVGKYHGWDPNLLLGTELTGKTLGILGLGRIGFEVAQRAEQGLGMRVMYFDVIRNKEFEDKYPGCYHSFTDVLKTADVISLHVPLLPTTRHMIGEKELRMMKKTAYLINTARGPVVDEKALVAALRNRTIAGAGIDVYEFEPKLAAGLAKLSNVVLTPHIASSTIEARSAMADLAVDALLDFFAGKTPKNVVNKDVLGKA
ncbi:D-glycerate dehydrogenase [Candidatus Woesearchaeota archaeon]|nr:D-glycerate dehydrogenase [Candidatus Woesearchaeota archaeon]